MIADFNTSNIYSNIYICIFLNITKQLNACGNRRWLKLLFLGQTEVLAFSFIIRFNKWCVFFAYINLEYEDKWSEKNSLNRLVWWHSPNACQQNLFSAAKFD